MIRVHCDRGEGLDRRLQFTDKAIPPSRERLHEARVLRRVSQNLANLVNGCVQVALDIDEGVRPEALLQLLSRHDLSGTFKQYGKDLEGLAAEFQLRSVLAQLSGAEIRFESTEVYNPRTGLCLSHRERFLASKCNRCARVTPNAPV